MFVFDGWGETNTLLLDLAKLFAIPSYCLSSASWSVTGSKVHTKIEFMHYRSDFIELYFGMGLTYKAIKSVLGSRHGFEETAEKISQREGTFLS